MSGKSWIYKVFMFSRILCLFAIFLISSCAHLPYQSPDEALKNLKSSVVKVDTEYTTCTGFFIGKNHFLTSAHCFINNFNQKFIIIDEDQVKYKAKIIKYDEARDLALIEAVGVFRAKAFEFWNEDTDGKVLLGSPILSMGYPGYYLGSFIFESSYFVGEGKIDGNIDCVICKNCVYQGESGGPMISLVNGKVIGVIDSNSERITHFDSERHQHNTLGLAVSYKEVKQFLDR